VHHSTVADHLGETEPSPLAKRYAAMVVEIREALEANFREALDATEKGDYPRMVAAMKAKALLTQQAKGIVSARSLYVEQGEPQSPEGEDAASFLAGLAKGKGSKGASTSANGGKRAASRAT
jgi:hypothetical protein